MEPAPQGRHQRDIGHQLLAESIQLQQRVARVPLPVEPPKTHPVLRVTACLLVAMVAVVLCWMLLPPVTVS